MSEATESLTLKWGSLKGWDLNTEKSLGILNAWIKLGVSMSAACQRDTPEQKQLLCDLIDSVDGEIWNDWEGKILTKEEAKLYVTEYGKPAAAAGGRMDISEAAS